MKRRHAKGYTEYARLDNLRYHRTYKDGADSDGTPLCVCSYPLVPTKEERTAMKERERRNARSAATSTRNKNLRFGQIALDNSHNMLYKILLAYETEQM